MTLKRLTIEYLDIEILYSKDTIVIVLFTADTIPQAFYCLVAELGTGVISMYRTLRASERFRQGEQNEQSSRLSLFQAQSVYNVFPLICEGLVLSHRCLKLQIIQTCNSYVFFYKNRPMVKFNL